MNDNAKEIRTKIATVMGYVYGVGIMLSLFIGALTFLGYLVALIAGGDVAADICEFIYRKIYPVLFTATSVIVLIGLAKMYVAGEKSLAPKKKSKEAPDVEKTEDCPEEQTEEHPEEQTEEKSQEQTTEQSEETTTEN